MITLQEAIALKAMIAYLLTQGIVRPDPAHKGVGTAQHKVPVCS
jgi:hypothetical protein